MCKCCRQIWNSLSVTSVVSQSSSTIMSLQVAAAAAGCLLSAAGRGHHSWIISSVCWLRLILSAEAGLKKDWSPSIQNFPLNFFKIKHFQFWLSCLITLQNVPSAKPRSVSLGDLELERFFLTFWQSYIQWMLKRMWTHLFSYKSLCTFDLWLFFMVLFGAIQK